MAARFRSSVIGQGFADFTPNDSIEYTLYTSGAGHFVE